MRLHFWNDIFPFEFDEHDNIKGYYHDNEHKVYTYRLEGYSEDNSTRIKVQLLPNWRRTQQYEYKFINLKIINDQQYNDFKPLVNQILDSNKSININGRAGTGKSTLIKESYKELDNRKLKYVSLAPTNKAARVISGSTIAKCIASFNMKMFMNNKYDYIIIDEISMVQEMYYKLFIYLKELIQKLNLL